MPGSEVKKHLRPFIEPIFTFILGMIWWFILTQAGTWVGITRPSAVVPALMIVSALVMIWAFSRSRKNSLWHSTPLDLALPIWGLALLISTAANGSMLQFIAVGLWFAGLYILIWYIVCDGLINQLISPARIVDSLLLASVPILASALQEFFKYQSGERVTGMMKNPNILAAFLVLILPLAFNRILTTHGYKRAAYVLFAGIMGFVLLLSQSRGGALGLCYSFGLMLFLHTKHPIKRAAIVIAALLVVFLLFGLRGDTGRVPIYEHALKAFYENPLTGQGLFTYRTLEFSRAYLLLLPPDGQNLHAHNIGVQIAVELGVIGVLAFGVTLLQFARVTHSTSVQQWSFAALFGVLAQQMVDFTLMTPSIAVVTIVLLGIASVTDSPKAYKTRLPVWLLIGLALLLIFTGAAIGHVPRDLL